MRAARDLLRVPPAAASPRCVVLSGQDDLARMTPAFDRVLCDDFDLAGMAGKLCPARLVDGSGVVFAVQDEARSDAAWELARQLQQRGYRLAEPACRIVPATLLLALTSRRVRSDTLTSRRQVLADPQRSALAHAFAEIVAWGVQAHASDIHLNVRTRQAESQVRYTVAGRYVSPDCYARMPTATLREILAVAWMEVQGGNGSVFDPAIEQQGRIWHPSAGRNIMLRWASLATDAGPSVCLRIVRLDDTLATADLAGLGYLPGQVDILSRASRVEGGAVVLAGVVGSGKSTTLAAMMRAIPDTRKVITLEDPVEYLIPGALQNTVGRDLETPAATVFDAKLRTLKRSAMNDLMIGEIRDVQTGRAFMDLAGSGVSVYTTTHAGSAVLVAERLASDFIGIARDFLATPGVLKLLGYQALLPALCQACALPLDSLQAEPRATRDWRGWVGSIESAYGVDCTGMRVRNPVGCSHCASGQVPGLAGTRGRTVATELVQPDTDPECLRLIRARDNLGLARHVAASRHAAFDEPDMQGKSAMACALYKALQGWVDPRDVEARFRPFDQVPAWERGR